MSKLDKIVNVLKERWGVSTAFDVVVILIVFAITGFLSLFVSKFVFEALNLTSEDPFWLRAVVYIFTVLPAYQVILFIVGNLLGQGKFVRSFLKMMFGRLMFWKKKKKAKEV